MLMDIASSHISTLVAVSAAIWAAGRSLTRPGGLPTAAGGGGAESAAEPAGAARESAAGAAASNVSGRDDEAGRGSGPAPGGTGEEEHE